MKKNIFFLLIIMAWLSSCTDVKKTKEYVLIQTQNDSLVALVNNQNTDINNFISDFNDIQSNLSQIREKERLISVNRKNKDRRSRKSQITEDIHSIYALLRENKAKLKNLQKRLSSSDSKNESLKKLIENLQLQINDRNAEIVRLNTVLKGMNIDIMTLEGELDEANYLLEESEETIKKQNKEMNRAYYVVGTTKELKNNNIITKKGGFIGIGRQSKMDESFDKSYFKEVDINSLKQVPIFAKKPKLISTHPKGSYEFVEGESKTDYLLVKDAKAFWSVSKYLIIEVKK